MPEQADDGSLTARDGVPFPIAPRKKAAFLITIIHLSILQIAFGALSLPIIYRHSGYGRRGAWTRPWNEDGVPGMAVFGGVMSLVLFGGNGLSELHPRHPCYSRGGTILGVTIILWLNGPLFVPHAIEFAWHFLRFAKEDRDAYWLGVWTVCIITATVLNLAVTFIYWMLAGKAMAGEMAEANVASGETSEADRLLGSGTQNGGPEIISRA